MKVLFVVLLFLIGCDNHTGYEGERCNHDGTCSSDKLECALGGAGDSYCHPKKAPSDGCRYESDCFCEACAKQCGDRGLKQCNFSDTSVWGAKPAVCECK